MGLIPFMFPRLGRLVRMAELRRGCQNELQHLIVVRGCGLLFALLFLCKGGDKPKQ
jgi:hypothetical protein